MALDAEPMPKTPYWFHPQEMRVPAGGRGGEGGGGGSGFWLGGGTGPQTGAQARRQGGRAGRRGGREGWRAGRTGRCVENTIWVSRHTQPPLPSPSIPPTVGQQAKRELVAAGNL